MSGKDARADLLARAAREADQLRHAENLLADASYWLRHIGGEEPTKLHNEITAFRRELALDRSSPNTWANPK